MHDFVCSPIKQFFRKKVLGKKITETIFEQLLFVLKIKMCSYLYIVHEHEGLRHRRRIYTESTAKS